MQYLNIYVTQWSQEITVNTCDFCCWCWRQFDGLAWSVWLTMSPSKYIKSKLMTQRWSPGPLWFFSWTRLTHKFSVVHCWAVTTLCWLQPTTYLAHYISSNICSMVFHQFPVEPSWSSLSPAWFVWYLVAWSLRLGCRWYACSCFQFWKQPFCPLEIVCMAMM